MNGSIDRLFVYGTLRSDCHHPAHALVSRYFLLIGKARVQGKLYHCGEYPGAVPGGSDSFITGELYELRQGASYAEALQTLDRYEGVQEASGTPGLFRREPADVYYKDRTITAWIYWYNGNVGSKIRIASGDVLND